MKLWIRNILQYIVNSIESEEDKTLTEDYLKDIITEFKQSLKCQKKKSRRYLNYTKSIVH